MFSLSVSLYTSANVVCISLSLSFLDIVACRESPNMSSQSDPKENCEIFRKGSVLGSSDNKPGIDGAVVTLHRAFPSCPPVSIFGMSVATVLAARFENASWPSCSRRLSVSCPSKILAASATAASRSFGPTIWSPVPTPPTTLPPTVPPPTTAAAFAPARPLPLVMTKFSVQFDALPCTSARMSAPTRETSSVGSKPCSGTKTARFGCSLDRRTCVATRLMSPLSKLIAPLGRISTGSAAPFTSTSPPTPKFKTKGYTALSSGPTMSRKPRKRSGSCSSALASLSAVLPPFAGVPGGDARCKKPARLLRASLPKNPPVLVEPGRLAALTPPLGAAFG
mmetsp:Transcript_12915/g.46414  ORF Transcript_12915/g.46414 Transcript_12915/m.46414 type:complete len:337 (+) Transcript_12915:265-1275(+)